MKWLLRLYPRPWRDRYEAEFRALLDELGARPWSVRIIFDLIFGALDARLHPQLTAQSPESVPLASSPAGGATIGNDATPSKTPNYRQLLVYSVYMSVLLIAFAALFERPLTLRFLYEELTFFPSVVAWLFWFTARKDQTPRGRTVWRISLPIAVLLSVVSLFIMPE